MRLPTTFLVVPATQKVGGTGSRWDWGMNTIQNLVHGKQFRVLGVGRIAFRSIFSSHPDISSICGNKEKGFWCVRFQEIGKLFSSVSFICICILSV